MSGGIVTNEHVLGRELSYELNGWDTIVISPCRSEVGTSGKITGRVRTDRQKLLNDCNNPSPPPAFCSDNLKCFSELLAFQQLCIYVLLILKFYAHKHQNLQACTSLSNMFPTNIMGNKISIAIHNHHLYTTVINYYYHV